MATEEEIAERRRQKALDKQKTAYEGSSFWGIVKRVASWFNPLAISDTLERLPDTLPLKPENTSPNTKITSKDVYDYFRHPRKSQSVQKTFKAVYEFDPAGVVKKALSQTGGGVGGREASTIYSSLAIVGTGLAGLAATAAVVATGGLALIPAATVAVAGTAASALVSNRAGKLTAMAIAGKDRVNAAEKMQREYEISGDDAFKLVKNKKGKLIIQNTDVLEGYIAQKKQDYRDSGTSDLVWDIAKYELRKKQNKFYDSEKPKRTHLLQLADLNLEVDKLNGAKLFERFELAAGEDPNITLQPTRALMKYIEYKMIHQDGKEPPLTDEDKDKEWRKVGRALTKAGYKIKLEEGDDPRDDVTKARLSDYLDGVNQKITGPAFFERPDVDKPLFTRVGKDVKPTPELREYVKQRILTRDMYGGIAAPVTKAEVDKEIRAIHAATIKAGRDTTTTSIREYASIDPDKSFTRVGASTPSAGALEAINEFLQKNQISPEDGAVITAKLVSKYDWEELPNNGQVAQILRDDSSYFTSQLREDISVYRPDRQFTESAELMMKKLLADNKVPGDRIEETLKTVRTNIQKLLNPESKADVKLKVDIKLDALHESLDRYGAKLMDNKFQKPQTAVERETARREAKAAAPKGRPTAPAI